MAKTETSVDIARPAAEVWEYMTDLHNAKDWSTEVVDTTYSGLPHLIDDLGRHLRAQGAELPLSLRRSNESPLVPLASMFGAPVNDAIRGVYDRDFEAFGYTDPVPRNADPE